MLHLADVAAHVPSVQPVAEQRCCDEADAPAARDPVVEVPVGGRAEPRVEPPDRLEDGARHHDTAAAAEDDRPAELEKRLGDPALHTIEHPIQRPALCVDRLHSAMNQAEPGVSLELLDLPLELVW